MSEFSFRLPDLGEGMVEAEIVEWHVAVGDWVTEGDVVADIMTDKANVEVPAPVSGRVLRLGGTPGEMIAVGEELIAFETAEAASADGASGTTPQEPPAQRAEQAEEAAEGAADEEDDAPRASEPRPHRPPEPATPASEWEQPAPRSMRSRMRVPASPAIRKRAAEAGVDLSQIAGTGPGGRVLRRDLDAHLAAREMPPAEPSARPARAEASAEFEDIEITGVRRLIARRLTQSSQEIPHFTYVEEIDVTELERLRTRLNTLHDAHLTLLPFLAAALIRALPRFPQCNAHYDSEAGVLRQYRRVHLGIATQTGQGLKVPVTRDAERLDLWHLAAAIREVTTRARDGRATPAELTGSTITISSLGRLGGIVSTPLINHPETTILGVNKALERPVVVDGRITIRTMMNISGSFDHRIIDGYDAAALIAAIKGLLEEPALLWIPEPPAPNEPA